MGCVIKLANLIKKVSESDELEKLIDGEVVFNDSWKSFVDGELTESNKNDNYTLGGQQKMGDFSDEEEPAQFEDNMESIMGRFNSFNSQMSGFSSAQDPGFDEEDNENKENEDVFTFDSPTDYVEEHKVHIEVDMPLSEEERMQEGFTDSSFWKPEVSQDSSDLDDILADYE